MTLRMAAGCLLMIAGFGTGLSHPLIAQARPAAVQAQQAVTREGRYTLTSAMVGHAVDFGQFVAGAEFSPQDRATLGSQLAMEFHRDPAGETQGYRNIDTWLVRIAHQNLAERAKTRVAAASGQYFAQPKPGAGTELRDMIQRYSPVLAVNQARKQVLTRRDAEALAQAHAFVAEQTHMSVPSDLTQGELERWFRSNDANVQRAWPNLVLAQWSWANVRMVWPQLNGAQRAQLLQAAQSGPNNGAPLAHATDRVEVVCADYLIKRDVNRFVRISNQGLAVNGVLGAVHAGRP
jgi:hypothetical protein